MHVYGKGKITVFQSSLYCTNSSVIDLGDSVLICDPGWLPSEVESIRKYVEINHSGKKQFLFITHFDYDHVWGWQSFGDAEIIAPDISGNKELQHKCIDEWTLWDQEHYITRPYTPALPEMVKYSLSGPLTLRFGSVSIDFFPVPGHTSESYAVCIPEMGVLLAGDYLSDVEIPWIGSSVTDYAHSIGQFINIIEKLDPLLVIPGHGNARSSRSELLKQLEEAMWYIDNFNSSDEAMKTAIENYIHTFPFPEASRKIHSENLTVNNR